jgi:hypothetical protein
MAFLWGLVSSVGRIVFLRGSPERIYYTRRLFIVSLFLAVLASAAVQLLLFDDHLVFMLLRIFSELTMFMLMMVVLTAKIARFRLARMMLVLVLISLLADILLSAVGTVFSYRTAATQAVDAIAYAVGIVAMYGAASVVAWGLQRSLPMGAGVMLLYLAAVLGLDMAFRGLYQIMVS